MNRRQQACASLHAYSPGLYRGCAQAPVQPLWQLTSVRGAAGSRDMGEYRGASTDHCTTACTVLVILQYSTGVQYATHHFKAARPPGAVLIHV